MKLLTITNYALHRGVSIAAVQKAIASGRIKPIFDHNDNVRIDAEAADQQWEENTQHQYKPTAIANELQKEVFRQRVEKAEAEKKFNLPNQPEDSDPAKADELSYTEARTLREVYEAKLKQLEYEHQIGKMVIADDLKAGIYTAAKLTREALLNIPSRVSSQIAIETDSNRIHTLLTTEIHQALAELTRANG
jgi:hypothetical protein